MSEEQRKPIMKMREKDDIPGLGEGHDRTPYPQNPSSFMRIYLLDIKSGIPLSFDYGSVIILVFIIS
jgi:hypothetical protein